MNIPVKDISIVYETPLSERNLGFPRAEERIAAAFRRAKFLFVTEDKADASPLQMVAIFRANSLDILLIAPDEASRPEIFERPPLFRLTHDFKAEHKISGDALQTRADETLAELRKANVRDIDSEKAGVAVRNLINLWQRYRKLDAVTGRGPKG